tara:strand:- start:113 stop:295 length:183 start_codon:yes stop_codon:yes gene_type:complete
VVTTVHPEAKKESETGLETQFLLLLLLLLYYYHSSWQSALLVFFLPMIITNFVLMTRMKP